MLLQSSVCICITTKQNNSPTDVESIEESNHLLLLERLQMVILQCLPFIHSMSMSFRNGQGFGQLGVGLHFVCILASDEVSGIGE